MIRLRSTNPASRTRRGISLVETLAVMTGVGAMLAVCSVMIQLLLRLNTDSQARAGAATAVARLAQQFRRDAHGSAKAQLQEAARGKCASLRLAPAPEHVIAYEPEAAGVVRLESEKGKIVRRESYTLSGARAARFEVRDEGPLHLVVLSISGLPTRSGLEPSPPLEVVALVGKDKARPLAGKGGEPR